MPNCNRRAIPGNDAGCVCDGLEGATTHPAPLSQGEIQLFPIISLPGSNEKSPNLVAGALRFVRRKNYFVAFFSIFAFE